MVVAMLKNSSVAVNSHYQSATVLFVSVVVSMEINRRHYFQSNLCRYLSILTTAEQAFHIFKHINWIAWLAALWNAERNNSYCSACFHDCQSDNIFISQRKAAPFHNIYFKYNWVLFLSNKNSVAGDPEMRHWIGEWNVLMCSWTMVLQLAGSSQRKQRYSHTKLLPIILVTLC